jgi:hypothetical protein
MLLKLRKRNSTPPHNNQTPALNTPAFTFPVVGVPKRLQLFYQATAYAEPFREI